MKRNRADVLDTPTEQEDLAAHDETADELRFLAVISGYINTWSSVVVVLMVLILICVVLFIDKRIGIISIKYFFVGAGALQICAGVYLGMGKQRFMTKIIEQERFVKTRFVRSVDQYRAILELLRSLETELSNGANFTAVTLSPIKKKYESFVKNESSGEQSINIISQSDLALLFTISSASAVSGTLLVTLGTLIMAFSELFPKLVV